MIKGIFNTLYQNLSFSNIFLRRAVRTGVAVFISVLIYRDLSLVQGFWVPLTVIIVMQATTAATLRRGIQRFLGTFLGILLGSILVLNIKNTMVIDIFLIVFVFLAYYLKAFKEINYGVFVVPLTMMVVFLMAAVVPEKSHQLILARLYDTSLGALIGVIVTFVVLPNSLKEDINQGINALLLAQYQYLYAICHYLLQNDKNPEQMNQSRYTFETALSADRRFYNDWRYEVWAKFKKNHYYYAFLLHSEKLGQFLFSMHHLAHQASASLDDDVKILLANICKLTEEIDAQHLPELASINEQIKKIKFISTRSAFNNALIEDLVGYTEQLSLLLKVYSTSIVRNNA